ncbi:MAG: hypothetical protein LBR55_01205 [Bacteroidales bacterium]|jgi:hypothetical protein|nr:hypothetical protein [Bacteroidales bacterium]
MKNAIIILSALSLIVSGCGQNNTRKQAENNETAVEERQGIVSEQEKNNFIVENKIQFEEYVTDGMFLAGEIRLYDDNFNRIGELEISEITPIQILEKTSKMYNQEDDAYECDKANFLKVKYFDSNYIVFGQDVYEIDNDMKYSIENKDTLTVFPITHFEMGASDDEGLTGCDDFSFLVLHNETKNHYSLMKHIKNEGNEEVWRKYAVLYHDDGEYEKMYNLSIDEDTLIIGIKAWFQEGGAVYKLKVNLLSELFETEMSDKIEFEYNELDKMNEIK